MATPHGLVVPNIKKVQSLSILEVSTLSQFRASFSYLIIYFVEKDKKDSGQGGLCNFCLPRVVDWLIFYLQITKELSRLQQLALANKLNPDDITGGTITLSNIGAIGGKFGSPLVNVPEVCIIALGRIQKVPQFAEDGNVYPMSVLTVSSEWFTKFPQYKQFHILQI